MNGITKLLHACGQIWGRTLQVIRGVLLSRKTTEITPVTDGLLLPCACTCGGRCSWRCPLTRSTTFGARYGGGTWATVSGGHGSEWWRRGVGILCTGALSLPCTSPRTYNELNFMVTPCINNIKNFNFQLMHTTLKSAELLKHFKISKTAPICFGLQGNYHQGAKSVLS